MQTTTITTKDSLPVRQVTINALAIVGFIVLIVIGMALAIYAATFVPKAVTRLGSAAVYLSSIFVPAQVPTTLEVVTPGTTIPFGETPAGAGIVATTTAATTTPTTPKPTPTTPTAGATSSTVYPVGTGTTPAPLSGLPDLTATILSTGYLTTSDTSSFVASTNVPSGMRGAVKFSIANRGTNASGTFFFTASLPTSRVYTFSSDRQNSLLPNEHIEYVLGFDSTNSGNARQVVITVDPDKQVVESNESNNTWTATVDIK